MEQLHALWREIIRIDCEPDSKIPIAGGLIKICDVATQFLNGDDSCYAYCGELNQIDSKSLVGWISELPALDFLLCRENGEVLAVTEEEYDYFVYRRTITAQQVAAQNP